MNIIKEQGRLILDFGTSEKDIMKACENICNQIMKASNKRHEVLQKLQIRK